MSQTRRIFKYDLEVTSRQMVQIPKGASILHVGVQNDLLKLWALVDETKPPVTRIIRLVTTGEEFNPVGCEYIGSFEAAGWFIGHVFEQFEFGQADPISERFQADMREVRLDNPSYGV